MVNSVGGGPQIPEQLKNVAKTVQNTFENFKGILPSKADLKEKLDALTNPTTLKHNTLKKLNNASSFIKMNMSTKGIEQNSDKIKTQAKKTLSKTIASFGEAMKKLGTEITSSKHVNANSKIFDIGYSLETKGHEIKWNEDQNRLGKDGE